MRALYEIPRVAVPRFTIRSVALAIFAALALAVVIRPGVSDAVAFLTTKKADRLYLGNTQVVTQQGVAPDTRAAAVQVLCPSGMQATMGGAEAPGVGASAPTLIVLESRPVLGGSRSIGWYVEAVGQSGDVTFTLYAVCAG